MSELKKDLKIILYHATAISKTRSKLLSEKHLYLQGQVRQYNISQQNKAKFSNDEKVFLKFIEREEEMIDKALNLIDLTLQVINHMTGEHVHGVEKFVKLCKKHFTNIHDRLKKEHYMYIHKRMDLVAELFNMYEQDLRNEKRIMSILSRDTKKDSHLLAKIESSKYYPDELKKTRKNSIKGGLGLFGGVAFTYLNENIEVSETFVVVAAAIIVLGVGIIIGSSKYLEKDINATRKELHQIKHL